MKVVIYLAFCLAAAHGFVVPHGRCCSTPMRPGAAAPLLPPQQLLSSRTALRSTAAPVMGLFGLGTPEIAIIAGVAMLILGPDQLKKIAKDVGKVSAELKQVRTSRVKARGHFACLQWCALRCQVPEEFNKGLEVGAAELEKKKTTGTLIADADKPEEAKEAKEAKEA